MKAKIQKKYNRPRAQLYIHVRKKRLVHVEGNELHLFHRLALEGSRSQNFDVVIQSPTKFRNIFTRMKVSDVARRAAM